MKSIYLFVLLTLFCFILHAQSKNETEEIEKRISFLKERLHQNELIEMKEEVSGQSSMIADWRAYAEKVEKIRETEAEETKIRVEIKRLEDRKQSLASQKPE